MSDERGDAGFAPVSFRHVVLPLDGSPLARAALPTAQALAMRFGAQLTTISVASDEREAQHLRLDAAEALGGGANSDLVQVVVASDVALAIARHLDELDSAVVCMSTHGRGRVGGGLIGSVARLVLQTSKSPLVTVGPQADRPRFLVGRPRRRPSSWPGPLSVGGVVTCVDGSEAAETAVSVSAAWASALDLPWSILTVADDSASDGHGTRPNELGPADPQGYVDKLAQRWRDRVPRCEGEVFHDPIGVASGLRSYLSAHPAALVALATNARSGLDRIRLGSVAAEIVRTSTAPALVVPLASPALDPEC